MNWSAELVALVPLVVVTVTFTVPGCPAGETAVIEVDDTTVTFVAGTVPKSTVAPVPKLVPVMVTLVPPAVDPTFGLTFVTVGAGGAASVYCSLAACI